MSYLKLASSNLLTCNVSSKNKKTLNLGPKIPYLGIFGLQFNRNYYQIFNQYSRIWKTIKCHPEPKKNKLRTEKALLGLWAGMFKDYCHICNQRSPICRIAKFRAKIRILKFGIKNVLFGYFWAGMWKQYCHIWKQLSRISQTAKFRKKVKMPRFGTKNALFGYFGARISKKYCHIWNKHPQICHKWVFNWYNKFWYRVRFF